MVESAINTTLVNEEPAEEAVGRGELALQWVHPPEVEASHWLEPGRHVLGRDPACAVRLGASSVSRRHAEIRVARGACTIADLGSANGTFVDGKRSREALVQLGTVVRIGDCVGVIVHLPTGVSTGFAEVAPGLWGGARLRAVLDPVRRVARTGIPIVLEGETGTGKEVFAQAIHHLSERTGPFVGVNCAAIPDGLAEAELFGHARGAFTGANRSNQGYLRAAHQGTLLLDEVVDLAPSIQAKLLRALELGLITPLGESLSHAVDLRLVSAAQQPLPDSVQRGSFRGDLFARLNGITIEIPPLRRRAEDIPGLFTLFARESAPHSPLALSSTGAEALCLHPFFHNVRELQQLARRMTALYGGGVLRRSHLATDLERSRRLTAPAERTMDSVPQQELAALQQALMSCGGNVSRASALMGISRQKVYRLVKRLDVGVVAGARRARRRSE